jgi:type I restriction enzyme S subunit
MRLGNIAEVSAGQSAPQDSKCCGGSMKTERFMSLSSVCNFNMGQSPESASYNQDGDGLPFFQGNADFGELHPKVRYWCSRPIKVAHVNDILISVRAPIGALNIVVEKCCIGRGLAALTAKSDVSDTQYLLYALRSRVDELVASGTGSTFKAISKTILGNTVIPVPDLSIQTEIVAKLNKASELIELRKQQLEKMDLMVKSQFIEMFGAGLSGEAIELKDVCTIITDGTHQPPKFIDAGVPFLFVSNIADNKITYNTDKYISREDYEILIKRTPIEVGDILLTTVGSYGNPAIVKSAREFCFQRHIAYMKPNSEILNSVYLHAAFRSDVVREQVEVKVKGIAQKTLNLSELKTIRVNLPPLSLQNRFAAFVEQADKSKFTMRQELEKLEVLYQALMQEYFG